MDYIDVMDMEFAKAYVQMFDLIDDCIFVVDMNSKILLFNKASEMLDDVKREDVLGKTLEEVYISERYNSATMECLKTKEAIENMVQNYTTIYGKNVLTISSSYPLVKEEDMVGVMTITKDISKFYKIMDVFHHHEPKAITEVKEKPKYIFEDLIGENILFKETLENAKLAAKTRSNVLIYGETGTGKELFAQSIHNESNVKGRFVPINCAAIPDNLLESLLFGTSKGAYTGAENSAGLFEEAKGGTLFLDEINSMSLNLQAKILRAVETGKIRRVGETKEEKITFRLVSAINIDPYEAIKEGFLRRDLYYRLGVVTVKIPPLRKRKDDIPILLEYFIDKYNKRCHKKIRGFDRESVEIFKKYSWPGNVRELEHAVEHSCIMAEDGLEINHGNLPHFLKEKVSSEINNTEKNPGVIYQDKIDLDKYLLDLEHEIIREKLLKNRGNVAQTARDLGLSRQTLSYRINRQKLQ
ncbi:MAG: sigma 54-interacting transcriptional regulator [Tissierellia bacterium]|nr:sigma 54-interacting transcriptional regulator [Tissierellia bacterium]